MALGRTVSELQSSITQSEFLAWIEFYKMYPFDDFHRYYRPAALQVASRGGDAKQALDWLQPDPAFDGFSQSDINTFRALGITPKD